MKNENINSNSLCVIKFYYQWFGVGRLNNIMFDCTIFVIVMSWTSATYDSMFMCNAPSTRNAKSILLSFDYSEYSTYFFVRVDN